MVNWISNKTYYSLIIIGLLSACEQEGPIEVLRLAPGLTPEETLVAKDWRYRDLLIDGDTLNIIHLDYEPVVFDDDIFHIKFRWMHYVSNKTYELRKEKTISLFSISLGGDNQSLNHQPGFGYWQVNDAGDSLIHNEYDASYRTAYFIVHLSDTLFIREYKRIVQLTSDSIRWPLDSVVVYREVFEPRK